MMSRSLLAVVVAEHLELEAGLGAASSADKWQQQSLPCVPRTLLLAAHMQVLSDVILLQLCKEGDLPVLLHT